MCRCFGHLSHVLEANRNRVISITILAKAILEEVEKIIGNICEVTNAWFTPIFNLFKDEGLPEEQKQVKKTKSKAEQYMIQNNKLYYWTWTFVLN